MSTAELATKQRGWRGVSAQALIRAASGGFALSIFNTGASVITTVALARLMTLEAFGTYSWVVATVYLLSVPAVLGVDRLLVRDVSVYLGRGAHGHVRGLMRRAIQLVITTCSLIVAVIAVIALLSAGSVDPATISALLIGVIGLPALAIAFVAQAALVGMSHVVVGQAAELLLRPGLLLAFVVGAALAGATIDAPLAATLFTASAIGSATVACIVLFRRARSTIAPAAPIYETRRWLVAALSLLLLGGALLINSQIGVVMLGLLDHPETVGLYAVAQRGAFLVAFPLLALSAAIAPTAARLWSQGEVRQLQHLATLGARAVLLASLPIALAFIFGGRQLLELVFGAAFAPAAVPLAILSLGQIGNALTGAVATLLMMTGHQWRASAGIVAGMGLNVGLGLILIPTHGAAGAAVAAATGLVTANVIHVLMARTTLGLDPTALGLPGRQAR